MRIDLKYWKACKCMDGVIPVPNSVTDEHPDGGWVTCLTCKGKGYTEETMVFPEDGNLDVEGKGMFTLCRKHWGYKIEYWESGESEDVTESLNIQSLHFIKEKECSHCEGVGDMSPDSCENCSDGTVEEEISFTIFYKSQEEYDEQKYDRGFNQALTEILFRLDEYKNESLEDTISMIRGYSQNNLTEFNSEQETNGHT